MGFPHRGLLRKLRQPARHRSHAPLTSVADLPRFTCLDSGILRRLPVALFILACRKLAEVSNASVIDAAAQCFAYMSKHLRPAVLTYHCQFLLHGLSDHVGRGDVFNPQRRINGFMFFSLSVLNLEDHLGLVISPQSPLSAGYITLRACRRSLPLRFSTVTPGGIVGFLIVSYRFNIPDRLAVHLSIHARPELRAHRK
ncbi:putative transposase family protein [Escherichia coli]|nr:putative transposase family protein [Escherichia coli]